MRISDWSSDVCSSDLVVDGQSAERTNFAIGDQPIGPRVDVALSVVTALIADHPALDSADTSSNQPVGEHLEGCVRRRRAVHLARQEVGAEHRVTTTDEPQIPGHHNVHRWDCGWHLCAQPPTSTEAIARTGTR